MGIRSYGPAFVNGDIQAALASMTELGLVLKKKTNNNAFHFVQEVPATDQWRSTKIESDENTADLFTKCLPSEKKRQTFCDRLLYHLKTASAEQFGNEGQVVEKNSPS